ncbi:hypothetical protein AYO21_03956 [Fonsecaea monophora]|uniref:Uncharacterized protein n=1 Tax=Fonsecaea monophora TaxID=254056 RepID=A0A177FDD3_9EURO|nr:hypothetical protein AYO21_03956 [Fonsecaea monophora]OAG41721.1 hypothetical protein AYO21_03956 [Fonsecaea monophora]
MPSPLAIEGLTATDISQKIELLIHNLVNIKDETGHFLLKLPDGRIIDTKGWHDWEWTHGIGLYGLYQYHALTSSPVALSTMQDWFSRRLAEGTTKNINTMAAFLSLAYLYEETRERSYLPWLESWAEWAMHDLPRTTFGGMQHITYLEENHNQLWDDTLMMTVMPLAKIGRLLNRPSYVEEAKRQFLLHIQYLYDPQTGLFFHGWQFTDDGDAQLGHNFARARWARGNSWVTIAIPDFIELLDLPSDDGLRLYLVGVLQAQCRALRALQTKEGMWRTLLDVSEEEGSYQEASATAGFAYGLLKSIRRRYISKEYLDVATRAIKAVIQRISEDGELSDVSFGTGMGKDLKHYLDIERTTKYPGPLLWRASRLPASWRQARGDLYKSIDAIHTEYGPVVRIAPDELSFTNPEGWAQIYNSRPQLQKTRFHFPSAETRKVPESMIMASDADHNRLRRLANPAFTTTGVLEVEPVMQHYVDLLCAQLTEACHEGSQNMVEWFLWTLNDVIGQLALDQEFDCLKKRRMHPWPSFLLQGLKKATIFNQFRRFGITERMLMPLMTAKQLHERNNFFDAANSAVKQRLDREDDEDGDDERGKEKEKKKKRPDIVGLMLREMKDGNRLTHDEVVSNSVLIVGGGAETTSTCLSATFYHLCKTPRVMKKLQDEIRRTFTASGDITVRATSNLPYLRATVDEALRIFPVASYITPRTTPKGGHLIAGEFVPEGTYVSMGQWHMGRSGRLFDNPKEFRPERWLEELGDKGPSGLQADEILKPFSLGPRNCIGKQVALTEARLVIAKLLWHFNMELDGDHPTWVEDARFYVLWELQPLKVRLTPVERCM